VARQPPCGHIGSVGGRVGDRGRVSPPDACIPHFPHVRSSQGQGGARREGCHGIAPVVRGPFPLRHPARHAWNKALSSLRSLRIIGTGMGGFPSLCGCYFNPKTK